MKKLVLTLSLLQIFAHLCAQDFRVIEKVNKHVSIIAPLDPNDQLAVQLYGVSVDKVLQIPMMYYDYEITTKMIYLQGLTGNDPSRLFMGGVNLNGDLVIPVEYDYIDDNYNGTYSLKKGDFWGVCNEAGKLIVPVECSKIDIYTDLILAIKQTGSALYKVDGTELVPFGPHEIRIFDQFDEVYSVTENGHFVQRFEKDKNILDGFIQVSPTMFAQRTEVSIREYFGFIADQRWAGLLYDKNMKQVAIEDLLPDTNFVEEKLRPVYRNFLEQLAIEEGLDFVEYRLSQSKKENHKILIPMVDSKSTNYMLDFPITGITREQATMYTDWLKTIYSEFFSDYSHDHLVNYRLPTEKEWISIAESGLAEKMRPNHVLDSINAEGCMLFIYNNLPPCKTYSEYLTNSLGGGSTKALSMNADWNGLHQIFGNVSEFTSDPGINKGGSYYHSAQDARTTITQKGEGPQPYLGFRVVVDFVMEQ